MNTLSTLGLIHTFVAVLALIFAFVGLIREGKINPRSHVGTFYLVTTVLACISSFPLSRAGGFNAGHALGILVLVLFAVVYLAARTQVFGRFSAHVETFCMTFSLFISLIPGVNETLTRVPVGNPVASSMDDPVIKNTVLVFFVLFVVGVILQLRQLRSPIGKAKEAIH
jgi:hypothetical protein